MNWEQAQKLRQQLIYLEGLIAWNTREYIWKVIIGPEDSRHMERFRDLVDPGKPVNPRLILQAFRREELSVFFFLKAKGFIICREYREFLSANDISANDIEVDEKMPALLHHFQIP